MTIEKTGSAVVGYWRLVADGEPFRLLFPVGLVLGIVGVALWPAFAWGGIGYPLEAHAGLMIQGFLASFAIGFWGTALPRLLEVPKLGFGETGSYAFGIALVATAHMAGLHTLADLGFFVLLCAFVAGLLHRAKHRKDIPPPGFVLVLMGLLSGIVGTGIQVVAGWFPSAVPGEVFVFGKRLLQHGFLLFPVMGIGAFLLPRFLGLPSRQAFPESLRPPPGWWPCAAFAGLCGMVVLTSFGLEAAGLFRAGYGLRALAILVYFFREVPIHRTEFSRGSLAWSLWAALLAFPVGYLAMAILPERQSTLVHIVFITGFSLLTLTVASRVVLGHGGRSHLFAACLKSIISMELLFFLAMATRVVADWLPESRYEYYSYAALSWIAAAGVWAVAILPGVRQVDEET